MLNLDLEYKKGILFIRLNGILDKYTSLILDDAVKKVVNKAGIKYLLINFENLRYIDCFGFNAVLNTYNKYIKGRGKLMICGYDPCINKEKGTKELFSYASILNNEASAFNLVNI